MFQMWEEGAYCPKLLGMSGASKDDDVQRLEKDGGRRELKEGRGRDQS